MHSSNMTSGNMLKHIIGFAVPVAVSGVLQVAYNSADSVVVGRFAGDDALAAVGSAAPVINLIINIFLGLSTAANVMVARQLGAKDKEGVSKTVHTTMTTCVAAGIIVAIFGVLFAENLTRLTGLKGMVAKLSAVYMRIYFVGVPAMLLYNFGSAVMYATGDTSRPAVYIVFSGIINVILNIVFVAKFKMSVSGVAIATVISQIISASLVLNRLINTKECHKLCIRKMRIYIKEFKGLVCIGIPASFQSMLVATSNVIVQTCINKCGGAVIAGSSAAAGIEGIIYMMLYSFFQAAMTFTSQNCGAGDFYRVKKGFVITTTVSLLCGFAITGTATHFSGELLKLFSDSEAVINAGAQRMKIVCASYFLYGMAEAANGALRGTGATGKAVAAGVIGDFIVRLGIVLVGVPYKNATDLDILFWSFPISWIVTGITMTIFFFLEIKKQKMRYAAVRKDEIL